MPFVSRAGEKLQFALEHFGIKPSGFICADFGSNKGGFVDCLLQNGAKKVYAVETGYGILEWVLRKDERVVVKERTNAMHVTLPELVNLITLDTSWTKLSKVIPNALKNLVNDGIIIALVKPHYEAGEEYLRDGKVSDEIAKSILEKVKIEIEALGARIINDLESPIKGEKAQNTEFLLYIKKAEVM